VKPIRGFTNPTLKGGSLLRVKRPRHPKIVCMIIPNFSVEVCLRNHPELTSTPLALAESELDDAEIIAVNQQAADTGLLLHITSAQAHILCPDLTIKVRNTDREIEQSNAVYKKLQSLSPLVEEPRPGLYFLDASGFELLYPDDRLFAARAIKAVDSYSERPYPCRVGLGRNKFIAQVAADLSDNGLFTIVPPEGEKSFLRPLPIERFQTDQLRLPAETLDSLRDLGLHTIGQVAAFPANEMIRRFGPQGEILSQLARGDDTAFFTPDHPIEPLAETIWFDAPLDRIDMIIKHAEHILPRLLSNLGRYSRGCSTIDIILYLDGSLGAHPFNPTPKGGPPQQGALRPFVKLRAGEAQGGNGKSISPQDSRPPRNVLLPISVERPTLSVKMFLRQLRITLEKQKPAAPINGLTVTIPVTSSLLTEQLPLSDNLAAGANPVTGLPDSPAIVRLIRRDLFLPEQRLVFSEPTIGLAPDTRDFRPSWSNHCPYSNSTVSGLRLYRPAREIEVTVEQNRPVAIKQAQIEGDGPWEISGGWWSRDYARRYWEVRTAGGRRFLIYQDRLINRWFLQGVFD